MQNIMSVIISGIKRVRENFRVGRMWRGPIIIVVMGLTGVAATYVQGAVGTPADLGWWIQQGGQAALLGLVLFWKRQDDTRYADDLKGMNKQLADLSAKVIDALISNAQALTSVIVMLRDIGPETKKSKIGD